ncbi:MAG: elongation factor Ts [Chloroflexi bacterium]|nr:elongation factor Ts [Chloroflexota bacterium]
MQITVDMVKQLRTRTGAGIMDAKKALEEAEGDMSKAEEILAKKGLASAAKRAGRETSQGVVESYIHSGSRVGSIVELNCETDFVARTPDFKALARNLAMQIAAMSPVYVDKETVPADAGEVSDEKILLEQAYIRDPGKTVRDVITEVVAKTGENIRVRRFARFALGE